jgi:hypothetical protein
MVTISCNILMRIQAWALHFSANIVLYFIFYYRNNFLQYFGANAVVGPGKVGAKSA